MSQVTILELLPQTTYNGGGTGNVYTVTGNAQPAAAYYLGNQDLQTVAIKTTNLTGNIVIQASLATSPTANDWFNVYTLEANVETTSTYTNVNGNFVYMRAKIEDFAEGVLQYIKLTY